MCSGTNAATAPSSSPTTCAAGSESLGFNVSVPRAGIYEVCGYYTHRASVDQNEGVAAAFQWVETPTNAQTITREGGTKLFDQIYSLAIAGGVGQLNAYPFSNCSLFNFSSSGVKGLRIMYEQVIQGTPNENVIIADQSASVGQRDIRVTMKPWLAATPAPLLIGSVTSAYSGLLRLEAARVTCAASASVDSASASWISIGNLSGGNCTLTFTTPFSSTPWCVAQSINATQTTIIQPKLTGVTASGATLTSAQVSSGSSTIASSSSTIADIHCLGQK
jgi:hypothetical protein